MNARTIFVFVSMLFAVCSCSSRTVNSQLKDEPYASVKSTNQSTSEANRRNFIGNTKGVLVLDKLNYRRDSPVEIYNSDGSLWYKFSFYYDDSDGKFDYENKSFKPFAFHPDYFLLVLKCLSENHEYYEVIVDEDTSLKKYVKKDSSTLKFETWEEHIRTLFSVDFDGEDNPLRETPDERSKAVGRRDGGTFEPVDTKGDWLKVRAADSKQIGWIRWKENDILQIEMFYFS